MAGQNPPNGAIIDYYLSAAPSGRISLDILDSRGQVLHQVTSATAEQPAALRRRAGTKRRIRILCGRVRE